MTSCDKKPTIAWRGTFLLIAMLCLAFVTGFRTSKPAPQRAFRGSYEGNVSAPAGVPEQYITFTANGHATHLGKFQMAAAGHLNLSTLQLTEATAIFTGVHGDQLFTEYESWGENNGDGTFWVQAEHTITGGNGRFEGAEGTIRTYSTASMTETAETVTISGKVYMEGSVSY